jgi:hypothetical protein
MPFMLLTMLGQNSDTIFEILNSKQQKIKNFGLTFERKNHFSCGFVET